MECRAAEHRGRDIADALDGIPPAAVGVLVRCQPAEAVVDQCFVFGTGTGRPGDHRQSGDGRCRREGRRGQLADPVAARRPFREQGFAGNLVGGAQSVGSYGGHCV